MNFCGLLYCARVVAQTAYVADDGHCMLQFISAQVYRPTVLRARHSVCARVRDSDGARRELGPRIKRRSCRRRQPQPRSVLRRVSFVPRHRRLHQRLDHSTHRRAAWARLDELQQCKFEAMPVYMRLLLLHATQHCACLQPATCNLRRPFKECHGLLRAVVFQLWARIELPYLWAGCQYQYHYTRE